MSTAVLPVFDFDLPAELAAGEPPEARGLNRDEVRLMVSRPGGNVITHTRFLDFPDFLRAGDVLVVNSSATIKGALPGRRRQTGEEMVVHLSTSLSERTWVIELRRRKAVGTNPLLDARSGERIMLPDQLEAVLVTPFIGRNHAAESTVRLWTAELSRPVDAIAYSNRFGAPIRYDYVTRGWDLRYYQTLFSRVPGSAEMPSAGRPFTHETIERLHKKGVRVAPIILHTGVASLETDEPPYPERYAVPQATADAVNHARSTGGRVIAVGTTVVRALETVADAGGWVQADNGWTDLVVSPERGVYVTDALLTGLHAPRATHLWMLEAIAGIDHLARTYRAALQRRYLWHEFGDVHLVVRG
jgi:S-adenosylmethionine:tRNA ribosyltransferase-isomerase